MWIKRDLLDNLKLDSLLEALFLRGPRQVGKTSILMALKPPPATSLFFDDNQTLNEARADPDFLLEKSRTPILIDEVQRAPGILISLKKRIDQMRRDRLKNPKPHGSHGAIFRMTGSNQTEVDQALQESLAGRVSIRPFHGLSVNELKNHRPETPLNELLFRGGFPELWVRPDLGVIPFMNDYISTFIEKDIAATAGVEKMHEFTRFLRLLAARVGQLMDYESIGAEAGVKGKTVKDWCALLEKNRIIHLLPVFSNNLNKRLTKTPKIYFLDSGICTRLQGHQEIGPILNTPHAGHLFENLVVAEALKTRDHFGRDWELSFWRTKEKEEIDLVVDQGPEIRLLEVKLGTQVPDRIEVPKDFAKKPGKSVRTAFVTGGGDRRRLASGCEVVPYSLLAKYLLKG